MKQSELSQHLLSVSDFHQDGDEATLRFHLKGGRPKTKGIHFAAAEAIAEYIPNSRRHADPRQPASPRSSDHDTPGLFDRETEQQSQVDAQRGGI